ncbi:nitrilase-related carbon-nitrogen hydrolase [Coraliomargarita parva]|uniref:nitrilase-related carbon-nitrogen hydrolase n=1 Tax=Coraliomargarita parva TaxID=3014050 RepID=UPI0022B3E03F|nr:nitrilase-related carbon-nitrogen hydrolase [Coraliomargarita parva]
MKIAVAQYSVYSGDVKPNLERIAGFARQVSGEAELLCLPEMCTSGFNWRANRGILDARQEYRSPIGQIAKDAGVDICGSFLEQSPSGKATNTFLYFDAEGELIGSYNKIHLFSPFREEQYVEAGSHTSVLSTRFGPIGCAVCYDLRFPELFRKTTVAGARIHILPAAFPKPRLNHWRVLAQARAIENQSFFIAVNQTGVEGNDPSNKKVEYFGHSMVVGPYGEILFEAGEDEEIGIIEIDAGLLDKARSTFNSIEDRRPETY